MISKVLTSKQFDLSQTVNIVGKYLYKNLSGAFDYQKSGNIYSVSLLVLYQIPGDIIKTYGLDADVEEMIINVDLTQYQTKIRMNLIEKSPEEVTLGHKTFDVAKFKDKYKHRYLEELLNSMYEYLKDVLEIRYRDYEFLF